MSSISVPSRSVSLKSKCSAGLAKKQCIFIVLKKFTKSAQSSGPENINPERPLPSLLAAEAVLSPSRITLENNEKIRPQPDRENAFAGASGGGDGPDIQPSPAAIKCSGAQIAASANRVRRQKLSQSSLPKQQRRSLSWPSKSATSEQEEWGAWLWHLSPSIKPDVGGPVL